MSSLDIFIIIYMQVSQLFKCSAAYGGYLNPMSIVSFLINPDMILLVIAVHN